MADNKSKRGKADRIRAAKGQDYEVQYVARKFRLSKAIVLKAIEKVGNLRTAVYDELRKVSARQRKKLRKA